jgi:hypothetical protein
VVGEAEAALADELGGEEDRRQDAYDREGLAGEGQGFLMLRSAPSFPARGALIT